MPVLGDIWLGLDSLSSQCDVLKKKKKLGLQQIKKKKRNKICPVVGPTDLCVHLTVTQCCRGFLHVNHTTTKEKGQSFECPPFSHIFHLNEVLVSICVKAQI